jgi:hypothetical protein
MSTNKIDLILFENCAEHAKGFHESGITSFMIDLEILGKDIRQLGFDTEIRPGTLADLTSIASIQGVKAWCRINRFHENTAEEIRAVVDAGAHVILLPMVTTVSEVQTFLDLVDNQCEKAVMIETQQAAAIAGDLNNLRIDHVFFGLNDFAISRGGGSIFRALADGSVEQVRSKMPNISFGFGGLTDITKGSPIPCKMLMEEMERLNCEFTFLRRAFRRDIQHAPPAAIVSNLQDYWQQCRHRSELQRAVDHGNLISLINGEAH